LGGSKKGFGGGKEPERKNRERTLRREQLGRYFSSGKKKKTDYKKWGNVGRELRGGWEVKGSHKRMFRTAC